MYTEAAHLSAHRRTAAVKVDASASSIRAAMRRSVVGRCLCDAFQFLCVLGLPGALFFVSLLLLGLRLDGSVAEWQVDGVGDASWVGVFVPAAVGFALLGASWCSLACITHPMCLVTTSRPTLYPGTVPCRKSCCIGCDVWHDHPIHEALNESELEDDMFPCWPDSCNSTWLWGCVPCTAVVGLLLLGLRAAAASADDGVDEGVLGGVSWMIIMVPSALFLCCFWGLSVLVSGADPRELLAFMMCCCVIPLICTLMVLGYFLDEVEAGDGDGEPFDPHLVVVPMYVVAGAAFLAVIGLCLAAINEDGMDAVFDTDEESCQSGWGSCAFVGVFVTQVVLIGDMLQTGGPKIADSYSDALGPALFLSFIISVAGILYALRSYHRRARGGHPYLVAYNSQHRRGPVQGCCGLCAAYGDLPSTTFGKMYGSMDDAGADERLTKHLHSQYTTAGHGAVPPRVRGALERGMKQLVEAHRDGAHVGGMRTMVAGDPRFLHFAGVSAKEVTKWGGQPVRRALPFVGALSSSASAPPAGMGGATAPLINLTNPDDAYDSDEPRVPHVDPVRLWDNAPERRPLDLPDAPLPPVLPLQQEERVRGLVFREVI